MGYKRKTKTFVLEFSGTEFEGLEIKVKSLPLGEFLKLSKLFEKDEKTDAEVETMIKMFFSAIKEWNVEEEDGTPTPLSYKNLLTFDLDFVMACISAWIGTLSGVDDELGKDSNSGETSLAASIPMDLDDK